MLRYKQSCPQCLLKPFTAGPLTFTMIPNLPSLPLVLYISVRFLVLAGFWLLPFSLSTVISINFGKSATIFLFVALKLYLVILLILCWFHYFMLDFSCFPPNISLFLSINGAGLLGMMFTENKIVPSLEHDRALTLSMIISARRTSLLLC